MTKPARGTLMRSWPLTCWDPGPEKEYTESYGVKSDRRTAAGSVQVTTTRLPDRIASAIDVAELTAFLKIACVVFFQDVRDCTPFTKATDRSREPLEWDRYRRQVIWSAAFTSYVTRGELSRQADERRMWRDCYHQVSPQLIAMKLKLERNDQHGWRVWCDVARHRPDIRARCERAAHIVLSAWSKSVRQERSSDEDIGDSIHVSRGVLDGSGNPRQFKTKARKRHIMDTDSDNDDDDDDNGNKDDIETDGGDVEDDDDDDNIHVSYPHQTKRTAHKTPKRRKPELVAVHVVELIFDGERASRTGEEAWVELPPTLTLEELRRLVWKVTSELGTLAPLTDTKEVKLFATQKSGEFFALYNNASLKAAWPSDGLELFACARAEDLSLKRAVKRLLTSRTASANRHSANMDPARVHSAGRRECERIRINAEQAVTSQNDADMAEPPPFIKEESDTEDEITVVKKESDSSHFRHSPDILRQLYENSSTTSGTIESRHVVGAQNVHSMTPPRPWHGANKYTATNIADDFRDMSSHGDASDADRVFSSRSKSAQLAPHRSIYASPHRCEDPRSYQQPTPADPARPTLLYRQQKPKPSLPSVTTSPMLHMEATTSSYQTTRAPHHLSSTSHDVDVDSPLPPLESGRPSAILSMSSRRVDLMLESHTNEGDMEETLEEDDPDLELEEEPDPNFDQDETMRISLGIERATADLPVATQLNATMVNEFCRWRGLDPTYWRPDASVPIIGFKGLVKETHLFTSYFLLKTESTLDPTGRQRIGGVLGHYMGVGKTACALVVHVVNLLERVRSSHVGTTRSRGASAHCPAGARAGAQCPSGRVGGVHGWRCPCEPDRPRLSTTDGATVAMVPLHTIGSWGTEIAKRVDLEILAQTLPVPPIWALAHEKTTIETMPHLVRWEDAALALRAEPVTTEDWLALNPGLTALEIPLLWKTEPRPHAPQFPIRYDASHVFILTTPQSAPTRLFPDAQVTFRPGYAKQLVPCRPDGRTCNGNKVSCTAKAHLQEAAAWNVTGIRWGRFILDEAHTSPMRMVTSKIKSLIVRELELRGGTPPAVWLATGTPMATAPTALLGFWAGWFNDRADLESSEALADFTPQRIQAAISADHLLVESIKNPRLTRSSKVWREVGGSPSTQTISPQDVHNTWTLQAQPTLQAWMDRAWIRFTLETEWAGRRLIPLPARIDQMITLVPYGADDTARLTALVETHRSSTRAYQEALAKHKTESRRIRGQDTLENLHRIRTTNGRRLRILLTCPRLHDLLGDSEGPMTNALTKTIQANGWYETPGKSPFARFAWKKSARYFSPRICQAAGALQTGWADLQWKQS
nr:hypothetical protein CFP56_44399 [Quercus suber]